MENEWTSGYFSGVSLGSRPSSEAGNTLTWTETKGANVGAARYGRWTLSGNLFYFQYEAPNVGMVTWNGTLDGAGTGMSGTYNAGANNAYGGSWSARKL